MNEIITLIIIVVLSIIFWKIKHKYLIKYIEQHKKQK